MAVQQLTLPGEIVKKHNELVRSKINIDSVLGSRLVASLIACVRQDDTQFKDVYRVPIKDFLPVDGRSYKNIKAVCRELIRASAEVEIIPPDGKPAFVLFSFFTKISYSKGIVAAEFNYRDMAGFLLELRRCFTEYNLLEYLQLPSAYSQRMFEILKSWGKMPEVTLSVAELHDMLNTPPSFQANFAEFKRRVLEKAQKDIQEKTTLRYEWEPIKRGRSVESIRFLFAPGRKALASASKEKDGQDKKSRLSNDRALRAYNCAKGKDGACAKRDNKPIICKLCMQMNYCDDMRRKAAATSDGPVSAGLAVQQVLGNIKNSG